jgi:hypothetical protein
LGGRFSKTAPQAALDIISSLDPPAVFPPVELIRLGVDGSVWIRLATGTDDSRWLVLDVSGTVYGEISFPEQSDVLYPDLSRPWVVSLDDDDVPSVVSFAITRK